MIAKTAKDSLKLMKRLYPMTKRTQRAPSMEVVVFNSEGHRVQYTRCPTNASLRKDHALGRCGAMCSYCYHDACDWYEIEVAQHEQWNEDL